ncbi:uncharacterized protein LOC100678844 [Nasonia vitripennis]|uniref:Nucleolar 27S pre-rRNA processing Urb2/Npa2 C-terminal domain-containing protein n=1 Tax=Nasonia vitripennis TaxID=7425 RepID=A0A7M7LKG7_NASVI|nr:uncharacterized protein LOC100678844 [Nasonia vitripennis]
MALSTGLIRRLDSSDEPLPKRLKLAENVFYSPDLPIVRKEECIFRWLCHAFSKENSSAIWTTIHRCLSLEPKNFTRLSPETKNLLIDKLVASLIEYPQTQVTNEMLMCGSYILSTTNIQSYTKDNKVVALIKTLLLFTNKVLNLSGETENKSENCIGAVDCAEQAVSTFAFICRQNLSEKKNLITIFIEEIFFPLSVLVKTLKLKKVSSKIVVESQKCIKRLLLGGINNINLTNDGKNAKAEESEVIFDILRNKVSASKLEDITAAFVCLFQCAGNTFQQNSNLIDIILRKLVETVEQKEHSKKVLICLLENSSDISYNFDHEIKGVSLKVYLKQYIEEIVSKKKRFKSFDYELLCAIAKLNPLIVEDETQAMLERILFEDKSHDKEMAAYENLLKELWKASVRLRRQQKFLSKFLLSISKYQDKEVECLEFKNEFQLPDNFITEFSEDLKSRTTSAQVISIFHTLLFHLKSDCIGKLKTSGPTTQVCITTKIVAKLLVVYFEHSHFLDSSLPKDWQNKFYQVFTDLRNTLALFCEVICETSVKHEEISFVAFSDIVRIWCETYDLLRYYLQNSASDKLDFPVNESQFKELKQIIKKCKHHNCEESLDQLCLLNSIVYNHDNQLVLKDKIITHLWSSILENHFQLLESFNETQILNLTSHFVEEASRNHETLTKWKSISRNIHRMTKMFATAMALQIFSYTVKDVEVSTTKTIIDKVDFGKLLISLRDSDSLKKVLKSARKEILKQDIKSSSPVDSDKTRRNLILLSSLPISYLDTSIRSFLFMVLYTLEKETEKNPDLKELFTNLYLDLLRQNDVDVMSNVSNPVILINHFKDNKPVLLKVFKSSLTSLAALSFWEEFISTEECNKTISCILLSCIDSSKNKASTNEHKILLHNLSLKLSFKIVRELHEGISDPEEISGVRVSLKVILLEKKKLKSSLKNCIEMTLKKVVENSETADNRLIHESLQLSLVTLSNREKFDINEDVVKKLCIILIHNPDGKIFSHFLEVLKDIEFDYFAKTLNNETKKGLTEGDASLLDKLITIWESLSKAETKAIRSKSLCTSVNNLFNELIASDIREISSVFLLKMCRAIVASKRMIRLSDRLVDSIFVTSTQSLNELCIDTKLIACQEALGLCLDFIRSKTDFLFDRLPALTNLFRKIIRIILHEAKETNFSDEQMLRILAVDIEKFCTFFAKLKKDVGRISPYLIADIIDASSQVGVLPSFLKVSIDSSLSHLLSNCDRHAISFLSRTLPVSTQQVFKTIYDNYIKYHKFTGKI